MVQDSVGDLDYPAVVYAEGHPVTGNAVTLESALTALGFSPGGGGAIGLVKYTIADLSGFDSELDLFDADGAVAVAVYAVIGTEVQGADATSLGVGYDGAETEGDFLYRETLESSPLPANNLWVGEAAFEDTNPFTLPWRYLANSRLIKMYALDGTITQGSMTVYCMWYPLETDATVTSLET